MKPEKTTVSSINQRKLTLKEPELIVEEDSNMRWRFNIYSTFTINENLLVYGDFVNILHCDSNACLTVENIEILPNFLKNSENNIKHDNKDSSNSASMFKTFGRASNMSGNNLVKNISSNNKEINIQVEKDNFNVNNTAAFYQSKFSPLKTKNLSNNINNNPEDDAFYNPDDLSEISNDMNENNTSFDERNINEDLLDSDYTINSKFYLRKYDIKELKLDVNSTWIIENIFPNVKNLCFVRYYDPSKLDSYRMTFRIKNFKTGKYLSIKKIAKKESEAVAHKIGHLQSKNAIYKFGLIDDVKQENEDHYLSEEYQYSLFGFHPSSHIEGTSVVASANNSSSRAEKNQFLRIFHVATKSYLKILYLDDKRQSDDNLLKCVLTLTQYEEEQEVFRILSIDHAYIWNFRFLNNMFYLFRSVINHVNENIRISNNMNNNVHGNSNCNSNRGDNAKVSQMNSIEFNSHKKIPDIDTNNTFNTNSPFKLNNKSSNNNSNLLSANFLNNLDFENSANDLTNLSVAEVKDKEDRDNNSLFKRVKYKILKTTNFILDKLHKFITNQFINKFSSNYDYKSVVYERQNLIAKFGFTSLILRDFIYDFWIDYKNMSNLIELSRIIKKMNEIGQEYFVNLSRKEKLIFKMYKYTDSLFQFLILYCKDNEEIKRELYEHLDVFLYFINLKESCVYCLIEIFKDNPKLLHSVTRDCKTNPRFRKALVKIYKSYFVKRLDTEDKILRRKLKTENELPGTGNNLNNLNDVNFPTFNNEPLIDDDLIEAQLNIEEMDKVKDEVVDEDINLIDLIFEYIKISKFEKNANYNNQKLLQKYMSETSAISLISRDKYFELLQALVFVKDGNNILENQRAIVDKILVNSSDNSEEEFALVNYLEKRNENIEYPPCLSELLVSIADENPDPNIQKFFKTRFRLEKLFSNNNLLNDPSNINDFGRNIVHVPGDKFVAIDSLSNYDQEQLAVNLKLISYFVVQHNKGNNNTGKDENNGNQGIAELSNKPVIKGIDIASNTKTAAKCDDKGITSNIQPIATLNNKDDTKIFSSKVYSYFKNLIQSIEKYFDIDNNIGKFNYSEKSEVNALISTIQFIRKVYENDMTDNLQSESTSTNSLGNFIGGLGKGISSLTSFGNNTNTARKKHEKKLISNLMYFITHSYFMLNDAHNHKGKNANSMKSSFSSSLQETMNKKQLIIKDRIVKSDHSIYLSIAESWLNVYLVFKNKLSKIFEENEENSITGKEGKTLASLKLPNSHRGKLSKMRSSLGVKRFRNSKRESNLNMMSNISNLPNTSNAMMLSSRMNLVSNMAINPTSYNKFTSQSNAKYRSNNAFKNPNFNSAVITGSNSNYKRVVMSMNKTKTFKAAIKQAEEEKLLRENTNEGEDVQYNNYRDNKEDNFLNFKKNSKNLRNKPNHHYSESRDIVISLFQERKKFEPRKWDFYLPEELEDNNRRKVMDKKYIFDDGEEKDFKDEENQNLNNNNCLPITSNRDSNYGITPLTPYSKPTAKMSIMRKLKNKKSGLALNINEETNSTNLIPSRLRSSYFSSGAYRKNTTRKSYNLDTDLGLKNENFREDERKKNKKEVITNILSLFELFLKKNITFMLDNFVNFYQQAKIDEVENEKNFQDFIKFCVPAIEGSSEIQHYIRNYSLGEKENKSRKNFWNQNLYNLTGNSLFDSLHDNKLGFVHNLMIAFNITDELEIQENILKIIYKSFSQRRKFFKKMMMFNDHLITSQFRDKNFNNFSGENLNSQSQTNFSQNSILKNSYLKFFNTYEKSKHRYSDEDLDETFKFFSDLQYELSFIFKKILVHLKNEILGVEIELDTQNNQYFNENEKNEKNPQNNNFSISHLRKNKIRKNFKISQFCNDNNEMLIKEIEKFLHTMDEIEQNAKENPITHENSNLNNLNSNLRIFEEIIKFFYFLRRNLNNSILSSISMILNQSYNIFSQFNYSVFRDFLDKGKKLMKKFLEKDLIRLLTKNFDKNSQSPNKHPQLRHQNSVENSRNAEFLILKENIKKKYFHCFSLLLILLQISVPRNRKTMDFMSSILLNNKELLNLDSNTSFILLLTLSDLQKENFALNYYMIMESLKNFNSDLGVAYRNPNIPFSNGLTNLYVDILINVLKYIIDKDKVIAEANLDEIVADNLIFLLKKIDKSFNKTESIIKLLKVLKTILRVESISKILKIKMETHEEGEKEGNIVGKENSTMDLLSKFPRPDEVLELFKFNIIRGIGEEIFKLNDEKNDGDKSDSKDIEIGNDIGNYNSNSSEEEKNNNNALIKDISSNNLGIYNINQCNNQGNNISNNQGNNQGNNINHHNGNKHSNSIINNNGNLSNTNNTFTINGRYIGFFKNAYTIYKYILLYLTEVNTFYFEDIKTSSNRLEIELVRELIQCIFYGYSYYSIDKEYRGDAEALINGGVDFDASPEREFYEQLVKCDFFVILNFYSLNFIKFPNNTLRFMEINELCLTNLNKLITDFVNKIEEKEIVISFSNTFTFNTDKKIKSNPNSRSEVHISEKFYTFYFTIKKLKQFLKKGEIFKISLAIIREKQKLIKNQIQQVKLMRKDKSRKFKEMILLNRKKIISLGNSEALSLVYYFLYLIEKDNEKKYEEILYTFLNKLIEFIFKSTMYRCSSRTVKINNFFQFIIKEFISFFDGKSEVELSYLRKKSLKEIQLLFERTGIVKNSLQMICNYSIPEVYDQLPYIFENFCMLLMKGNDMWQEIFFKNFTMNNEYELVFKFIYNMISDKMDSIITNKSNIIRNKKKKFLENFQVQSGLKFFNSDNATKLDSKILQFLQLLCENHNIKLQTLLHYQENFRKSFDLVSLTNMYLQVLYLHFEKHLFEPLVKCFDLLIEFIQGPCLPNQLAVINSKLLINIADILNIFVNSGESLKNLQKNEKQNSNLNDLQMVQENYSSNISSEGLKSLLHKMNPMQISLLAFKSSILLLALIEARRKDDKIYETITLNIKPELINLVYDTVYYQHMKNLETSDEDGEFTIRLRDLNRADEVAENIKDFKVKENTNSFGNAVSSSQLDYEIEDYLILETGFNLYYLHQYIKDYTYLNSKEEHSLQKKRKQSAFKIFGESGDRNILNLTFLFVKDLFISLMKIFTLSVSIFGYIVTLGRFKIFNITSRLLNRRKFSTENSTTFYFKHSKSIEILRDEVVYKIYFFSYPFLRNFNNFEKKTFLEGMDRTNSKTKLMDILKFSNNLKYELEYDYKIKRFLIFIPVIGIVFKHIELWKDLSLFLTLIQNFFNIAAFYKKSETQKICLDSQNSLADCFDITTFIDDKIYFNMSSFEFQQIINILAILQTCLAGIIVLEFFLRKTPTIIKEIQEEMASLNFSMTRRKFYYIKEFMLRTFFNFEVIYYICYITAAVLGFISVDFYFAFLLLEVITRFKTLKNVIMAIRNPIKELFLTFLLWIMLIYFFAVIAYANFRNDFKSETDCPDLVRCLATIFYESNKYDNGISLYLKPIPVGSENRNPLTARFFYDQLFNLIVKILIIQMVAGIIIDNFAKLRKEEMDMIKDMNTICTICGLKKDDIEKVYDKYGRSYEDHMQKDHNIFNYIFYIIYLHKKDKTEFNGMESYVYKMAFLEKDITWFPIDK
jgi:hypothetical protein